MPGFEATRYCSSTRDALAIPREIRYALVVHFTKSTQLPAPRSSLIQQTSQTTMTTTRYRKISALPGTGRRATFVGRFVLSMMLLSGCVSWDVDDLQLDPVRVVEE